MSERTDTERLDALGTLASVAWVKDGHGCWALSSGGLTNDSEWYLDLRSAIDAYLDAEKQRG